MGDWRSASVRVALFVVAVGLVAPQARAAGGLGPPGAISANYDTCAIESAGSISCWGDNVDGSVTGPDTAAGTFKAISTHDSHACAIDSANSISCWGTNSNNAVSDPDAAAGSFKAISTGTAYTCAIDSSNSISCWGRDDDGGEVTGPDADPGSFKEVSAGDVHTCAIDSANSISCWGASNDIGQVAVPSAAAGVFKSVAVGSQHTCAINASNLINCWGSNSNFQTSGPASAPGPFKQLSAGLQTTCAITTSNALQCWGNDGSGQVTGANNAGGTYKEVSVGDAHVCAIDTTNSISCWGTDGDPIDNRSSGPSAAAGTFGLGDLEMSLKGRPTPITVGSQLTYQLRMRSLGPFSTTGMTVKLTLSPSETFVSATSACSHAAGVVTCTIPRAILPGSGATPSVTVTETQVGLIQTTATVSSNLGDANPTNNTSTERTVVKP